MKYVFVLDDCEKDSSKLLSLEEGTLFLFIPVETEIITVNLDEVLNSKIRKAEEIKAAVSGRLNCEIVIGWGENVESVLKREDAILV